MGQTRVEISLSNGKKELVSCDETRYEELYDLWAEGTGILDFYEGCVRAKDVVFIRYVTTDWE